MDWSMPLDPADLERAAKLRQLFSACCNEIAEQRRNADAVAAAVATHLAAVTAADLPPAARLTWSERVARPLKADPGNPLPERAVGAIRSWPSARASDLCKALVEIESIIADAENEAQHEAIYVEISRAYS